MACTVISHKQVACAVEGQVKWKIQPRRKSASHPLRSKLIDASVAVAGAGDDICHKQIARLVKGQSLGAAQPGSKLALHSVRGKFENLAAAGVPPRHKQVLCWRACANHSDCSEAR